ncbi:hypothetical oxidoreductase [Mycobacterium tuberculosis GM 1503]|nr:hypothetical oxidoreductase [Mycobacterium tuberculosis GM 1503]
MRGLPRRTHRRQPDLDAPACGAGTAPAHRGDTRRGGGDQRPDRPRRPGGRRPLQPGDRAGSGAVLQSDRYAVRPEGDPRGHRRCAGRARPCRPAGPSTPAFDAVEIHLGHNYLASAFLSPLLNRRDDEFGGSLQNRAKVARGLVMAVRRAVRQQVAVTAKLNMTDGIRGGITVDEALTTARWLQDDGGLDAIELTAGSSLVNPMYLFRGDAPVKEFAAAFKPPLRWGIRMTGHRFFREYPYRDAYLLREARLFRAELTIPLILLGGITNRTTMDLAMAEGFEFVAMARALLAEPDLVNRIAAEGSQVRSACTHCNQCMATIYRRTHCVVTGAP